MIAKPKPSPGLEVFCLGRVLTIQPLLAWMELVDQAGLRMSNGPSSASSGLELKVCACLPAPWDLDFYFADIDFEDLHECQDTARED